jgi:hypothetical protein
MAAYLCWALPLLISETTELSEESVSIQRRQTQTASLVDFNDNYSHDAFDVVNLASSVNTRPAVNVVSHSRDQIALRDSP